MAPLAQGLRHHPTAMATYDDGAGARLFVAAGEFGHTISAFTTNLAAWDGGAWTDEAFLPNAGVMALAVFDDGAGPALFAGGANFQSGASLVSPLFKRTGTVWSSAGLALTTAGGAPGVVNALEVFDDGSGPALHAAGLFATANGVSVSNVVRWSAGAASALGGGVNSVVEDLHVHDDGSGPELFAAGDFSSAGGVAVNAVARWSVGSWKALGSPAGVESSTADSLASFDDGAGSALYVGGLFDAAGGVRADNIARWKAGAWSSLGVQQGFDGRVGALGAFDSGAGVELFAAGWFEWAGTTSASGFAKWNGATWSAIALDGSVHQLLSFDDGAGEALYAAGDFDSVGGVSASQIARWDGTQWSEVGGGVGIGQVVLDMAAYDDGAGEKLWIAGDFTSIGGVPAKRVARWDGVAWWSPNIGPSSTVKALAVHDDGQGGGEQLYVGGDFAKVGTVNYFGIARWNGSGWSKVGGGFSDEVVDLAVFDDGSGAMLFAAGKFVMAPPYAVNGIARWDGTAWLPVNGGVALGAAVNSLQAFDDGAGPALFAGGNFASIGGVAAKYLAVWRNSSWSAYAQPNGEVLTLRALSLAAGAPPTLCLGGRFTALDVRAQSRFALLEASCPCPPQSYCTAGVSSNGCAATLSASGSPSASLATPFVVTASGVEGQKQGLLFYGVNGRAASPWGSTSSFLCVKAPTQRTGTLNSGGAPNACDGVLALDWNSFLASHPGALGQPFQAGDSVYLQGWYRDPPSSKTTSLSDALEARVCP